MAKKKNNTPLEAWHSEQIFNWRFNNVKKWPMLQFMNGSINGIRLGFKAMKDAKKQGLTPGVFDIDLPYRNSYYNGLHIELKRLEGGKTSPEQIETGNFLREQGRLSVILKGHIDPIELIIAYVTDDIETMNKYELLSNKIFEKGKK